MKNLIDYVPKSKRAAVEDAFKDDMGQYWILLKDGYEARRIDYGCHTICEENIKALRYQIAGIRKAQAGA